MSAYRAMIIGYGTIGRTLHAQLRNHHDFCVAKIVKRSGVYLPRDHEIILDEDGNDSMFEGIDIVFLAIPSSTIPTDAKQFMHEAISRSIPVVSCEKGALSRDFPEFREKLGFLGVSAMVGGGSGIIDYLQNRFNARTTQVHVILNGTINFIWDGVSAGNSFGYMVAEAQRLGLTEPGERSPRHAVNQELLGDCIMKTAILFNLCFRSTSIDTFYFRTLCHKELIDQALNEARSRRFVVSYLHTSMASEVTDYDLVILRYELDDWVIIGGFQSLRDPLIHRLSQVTPGVNNGVLIVQGKDGCDGIGVCAGLGAGPIPTVAAMIHDAEKLLKII